MAPAPAPRRRWRPHGALALAAAVLLVVIVATALVPPARSAVLKVLGLTGSARIVQAPRAPDVSRGPLDLGRPIALADARRRAPYLRLPAALGAPVQVRWSDQLAGGAVTLRWAGGDALTEFQGRGLPVPGEVRGTGDARAPRPRSARRADTSSTARRTRCW